MDKVLFIAGLDNISVSTNLGRGDKLADTFFITNDNGVVDSLLTQDFTRSAGLIETGTLRNGGTIIYAIEEQSPFVNEDAGMSHLNNLLVKIRIFMQALWLIKDNSVNTEFGYLEYPYKKRNSKVTVSRNFVSGLFSNASGTFNTVEFSREELRQARQILRNPVSIAEFTHIVSYIVQGGGRLSRALYFLQGARLAGDLGIKIANYSTAFEALFSTDTQELTHKLAERIACFVEKDPELRKNIFKEIKRSYGIRSRIVHGASGSKGFQEQLIKVSSFCDILLRSIFLRILADPVLQKQFEKSNNEEMEDYYLSLIFNSRTNK